MGVLCLSPRPSPSDSFSPAKPLVLAERAPLASRINFPQPNNQPPFGLDAGTAAIKSAESFNNQPYNIMNPHEPAAGADSPAIGKTPSPITGFWKHPVTINLNNFVHKSLSNWACNIAVGCNHGCRFCYVPDTSANKQSPELEKFGVEDPDEQWGQYVLLRPWDEKAFLASLHKAETTPIDV